MLADPAPSTETLTLERLAAIRQRHYSIASHCRTCDKPWPCDTDVVLSLFDAARQDQHDAQEYRALMADVREHIKRTGMTVNIVEYAAARQQGAERALADQLAYALSGIVAWEARQPAPRWPESGLDKAHEALAAYTARRGAALASPPDAEPPAGGTS